MGGVACGTQVQLNAHIEQGSVAGRMELSSSEAYLKGIAVWCETHPTLGTESQNILTDGMYLVMLPVGAVRLNTWNRQFSTSAT